MENGACATSFAWTVCNRLCEEAIDSGACDDVNTDKDVTCFCNGGGAISACNGGTRTSVASLIDDNCDSDLMEETSSPMISNSRDTTDHPHTP